jgi:polyisoprenyl-teichoic acid--peptidoglycan teichoic acid transferase
MERIEKSRVGIDLRMNRLQVGLLILFVILAGLIAAGTFVFVRGFVARWDITDLPGIVVNPRETPTPGGEDSPPPDNSPVTPPQSLGPEPQPWDGASRVNVLVVGLDYRDWESGEGAPRTDTMILLSVDPITKTAGMLSIPRDLWVNVPGFEPSRINGAYRNGEIYKVQGGGPGLAMRTVEELLGLKIDYFAQIDFYAFERFIDELGGIKVDVPERIKVDPLGSKNPRYLEPGAQVLPGDLALAYARARNSEGGDFDRAERQQQVIFGIRNRVMSSNMLPVLVGRAPALYDSIAAGVHTNLTLDQAIKLAWLAQQIPEENIKRGVIGTQHVTLNTSPDGDQVLKPRPEQIRLLRDEIFTADGPVSPAAVGAEPQDLMRMEGASLSILNGSGTPGLATRTAEYLAGEGAQVGSTGDAPEAYNATTIITYTGNPYTLKYLVEVMDINKNRIYHRYDPSSQVDIVLYLGYDWANNNTMP